jgi:hypothetical protein
MADSISPKPEISSVAQLIRHPELAPSPWQKTTIQKTIRDA